MGRKLPQEIELCLHLGVTPLPLCTPKPDGGCLQHGAGCPHPGKKPLVRWRKCWHPTTQELEKWAVQGVNWGISCGTGLAALDFDKEEDFWSFLQAHPQASSWPRVKTARGYHLWVRPKRAVRSQRLDGLEMKCLGSYVVAPPSRHSKGTQYHFEVTPNGALPEVDLETLLAADLTPPPVKTQDEAHNLTKHQQDEVEGILLQYLPGARRVGLELAGYLDPDSQSKAHVKVNMEKGVYMDWRRGKGGTIVELLRLLGAPVPSELGGMGEEDIPEYFPIWALGPSYPRDWRCGELVVVLRRDSIPIWAGKAFCLRWSCPECAIRMKNVLKRRLRKVKLCAIFKPPNRSETPKLLAKVKRDHRMLTYLRVLGVNDYVFVGDALPEVLSSLQQLGFELVNLNPSTENVDRVVDELPHANVRRRQRRLIASRGFWPVGVNGKHSDEPHLAGANTVEKTPSECILDNSDDPHLDVVIVNSTYHDVTEKLRRRGFQLIDVGLGESHRLVGQTAVAPHELGPVIETIRVANKRRVKRKGTEPLTAAGNPVARSQESPEI